jgi:hypothetical protein
MHRSNLPVVAFVVMSAFALPGTAGAEETGAPLAPAIVPQPTVPTAGPRTWLIDGGAAVFAASYVPVIVVGASSAQNADRSLFVPLAGPWIDLGQRPSCAPAIVCTSETSARALLIVDGLFQALGVVSFVGGLLTSEPETMQRVADPRSTLRITPAQIGAGGYGMVALGTF